jgi:hypothetical protein
MATDDLSFLPEQVRRQAEEADKMVAGISAEETSKADAAQETEQQQQVQTQVDQAPVPDFLQQPQDTSQVKNEVQQPIQQDQNQDQRYLDLQARYDKDVGELSKRLSDLTAQFTDVQHSLIAMMREKGTTKEDQPEESQKQQEQPVQLQKLDTGSYKDYGDEFEAMADNQNKLLEYVQRLEQKLATIDQGQQNVTQRFQQSDEARFNEELTRSVPDWQALNNDKNFLEWLNNPHEGSYTSRLANLRSAYDHKDAATTAYYFNQYKAAIGKPIQTAQIQQQRTVTQPQPPISQQGVAYQVTPSDAGASTPVGSNTNQAVTPEQFRQAAQDLIQRKITQDQFNAMEKSLHSYMSGVRG